MASGMFTPSFARFFGGDIDYVNDSISAYLVSSTYAPDRLNDVDVSDIPEVAILSETTVDGRFISGLALFADSLVFPTVAAGDLPGSAVVIFKDADLEGDSYLCFLYDSTASSDFPVTLDGTDVVINWPAAGLVVGTV